MLTTGERKKRYIEAFRMEKKTTVKKRDDSSTVTTQKQWKTAKTKEYKIVLLVYQQ